MAASHLHSPRIQELELVLPYFTRRELECRGCRLLCAGREAALCLLTEALCQPEKPPGSLWAHRRTHTITAHTPPLGLSRISVADPGGGGGYSLPLQAPAGRHPHPTQWPGTGMLGRRPSPPWAQQARNKHLIHKEMEGTSRNQSRATGDRVWISQGCFSTPQTP